MPQLGETVTEGTITRWVKQIGDPVEVDDVLFEVSTDKVDTEVPSAVAGYLREVYVHEGDTVPIGTLLAVVTDTADEVVDEAPAAPVTTPAPPEPRSRPEPLERPSRPPATPEPRPSAGDGFLSPVVRRLLTDHGLAAGDVVGSGRDGRITRADVLAAAANRSRPAGTVPAATLRPVGAVEAADMPVPGPDDDVVELSRARRNTAANMVRSIATSAHTLVVVEVDYHAVDAVRRAAGLSFLPFVARAAIDAIGDFPHVNASVGHDELIVHRRIHLGIAVDVDFQALVVPVVKDAGAMRLAAISDTVADLAARAKAKRLTADDLTGGTFTITNVGAYGTVVTGPIINQPQVAILSSDGVRMRPVAVKSSAGEWAVAIHPIGNLSLSFDHRAFDGAYASAFLARVRDLLEQRDWAQEV